MTKAELIEALKEFPDNMEIKAYMSFDWGDDTFDIDFVEYDYPYLFREDDSKKYISLRLF